jgi:hypothetical protein
MAGRSAGFAVGVLCAGTWFLSDIFSGPTYQHPLIPVWNAIMLFVFFFVVVWLLTAFAALISIWSKQWSAEPLRYGRRWKNASG